MTQIPTSLLQAIERSTINTKEIVSSFIRTDDVYNISVIEVRPEEIEHIWKIRNEIAKNDGKTITGADELIDEMGRIGGYESIFQYSIKRRTRPTTCLVWITKDKRYIGAVLSLKR